MNSIQRKILTLITPNGISGVTLAELGKMVGVPARQRVKYHLDRLEEDGLVVVSRSNGRIASIAPKTVGGAKLLSIPIYGSANCGPATLIAEENFEGYLKVSSSAVAGRNADGLFALRAVGPSMNTADAPGGPIEDGDYVIVDSNDRDPAKGSYVVSVIDGCANVKKFMKEQDRVVLISESESSEKFPPIFIYEGDDFLINGKVVQIIKKPKGGV